MNQAMINVPVYLAVYPPLNLFVKLATAFTVHVCVCVYECMYLCLYVYMYTKLLFSFNCPVNDYMVYKWVGHSQSIQSWTKAVP